MAGIVSKFVSNVAPGVIRPLRVLWNEVIGFLFIVLAVWSSSSVIRSIRALHTPEGSMFRLGVSAFFTGLMLFFGVASFWKARKISRS